MNQLPRLGACPSRSVTACPAAPIRGPQPSDTKRPPVGRPGPSRLDAVARKSLLARARQPGPWSARRAERTRQITAASGRRPPPTRSFCRCPRSCGDERRARRPRPRPPRASFVAAASRAAAKAPRRWGSPPRRCRNLARSFRAAGRPWSWLPSSRKKRLACHCVEARWPGAAYWRALGVARLRAADRGCRASCDRPTWAGAQARKLVQRRPWAVGRARSLSSPSLRRRPLQSDDGRIFFGGVKPATQKSRRRGAGLGLDNILVYARAPRAQQGRLPADHSTRLLH